jgi:CBS domain containing-hemolysin-like protein
MAAPATIVSVAALLAPSADWLVPSGDWQSVELAATISPLGAVGVLGCLAIASFGSFCVASLAVYSPTKLQNRLPVAAGTSLVQELERREGEFRIMARFYNIAGLIGALVAVESAVDAASLPWALVVLSVVALFACGSVPSAVADARAEATLLRTMPVLRGGLLLLRWPVVLPVQAITGGILRVLRIREEQPNDAEELAEEVMAAVADTVTENKLAAEEKTWIGNIVGLKDLQVSAIMTPRPDLVALPSDTPIRDAVQQALNHGFSRYPVYRDKVDEIIGIFYVKDALRVPGESAEAGLPVQTMLRPTLFVPESMGVAQLLRRFQADKVHMAIVLDEYGTTAGLVSVEDVLEQIVGDIGDEYDADGADAGDSIAVVEAGRVVEVPGRTAVGEINRLLGTEIRDDGDWETIAGYAIHHLNRIPAPDETFVVDGVEFRVLQADDRRIGRLRLTAHAPEPANRNA